MKMNEIIRKRRLEKGFTQEQLATCLGVSAPAVNKWEKGSSYPDIVLLPTLARLLGTDLNTLLSFQEDLSEKEISIFMNEVADTVEKSGFEAGYSVAMEKIKEFPSCDLLVVNLATLLAGSLMLKGNKNNLNEKYQSKIESLFQQAAQSDHIQIREQAQGYLISKFMDRKDYEQVQEILNKLPQKSFVDREQVQADLFISQGELKKAAKLTEERLLSATTEIHAALMTLMEIALKEDRIEDAEYIANVDKQGAQLFDLWDYNSYVAYSQFYAATKNRVNYLKTLLPMLKSLTKKWNINQSPLYRHIPAKEPEKSFGIQLKKILVQEIQRDVDSDFIRENSNFKEIIREVEREQND